jgi:hypothetical protein
VLRAQGADGNADCIIRRGFGTWRVLGLRGRWSGRRFPVIENRQRKYRTDMKIVFHDVRAIAHRVGNPPALDIGE